MRRFALLLIFAGLTALAVPALAGAAYVHPTVTESFGSDGTGASGFASMRKLAFNQADHRLYVLAGTGTNNTKIYAFDTAGGTHTPAGGDFPINVSSATYGASFNGLATDNALGSAGNVYYVSGESGERGGVFGFDSTGAPLGLGFPIPQSGGLWSVATDGEGNVWAGSSSNQLVQEFTSSGTTTRTSVAAPAGDVRQIAIDRTNGDIYVSGYSSVFRYTAASGYAEHIEIASGGSYTGLAFDSKSRTLYVVNSFPAEISAYKPSGGKLETFATSLNGVESIAVDEESGTAYVTAESSEKVNVIPGVVVPDATTAEETGDATLNGHLDPAGGGDVTGCEFEYGTDSSYGSAVPCSPAPNYSAPTDVSADLAGSLTPEVTYHYRLVATNANGTDYGEDRTFTPHFVTGLHTDPATEVHQQDVRLNGQFFGDGEDTDYYFEWGETTAYGSQSSTPPGETIPAATGVNSVSVQPHGLNPGTTYHYRFVASNGKGTSLGEDRTFTTVKAVPDLQTELATDLSGLGATLHGSYTGAAGSDVSCHFEYGTSAAYGTSTPEVDQGSAAGAQSVSLALNSLKELTSYHYRIVCHDETLGDAYGQDELMTTLALARIALLPPSDYTSPDASEPTAGVKLNATVNPEHGGATTFHYDYGKTDAYGASTPEVPLVGAPAGSNPASAVLTGLDPGTVYHYRLVATSSAGVRQTADQTLTSVPSPALVAATSATGVAPRTATLNTTVRPGSGATVVFFDYGPTASYGSSTPFTDPTPADEAEHELSAEIEGLSPGTTYHYRAVAVNFNGVTQGPDVTFTTPEEALPGGGGSGGSGAPSPAPAPTPVAPMPKPKNCHKNFVKRHGRCVKRKPRKHHKRQTKQAQGEGNG